MSKEIPILVVDLDGTLISTDMLHETFWSAFSRDWKVFFKALVALAYGKARLKDYLAEVSDVNVETLPFNSTVISYIQSFRESGGRTALVTASNEKIAQKIGMYLKLFDEIHGSDSLINLKAKNKAEFLSTRFGAKNYIYLGDSRADLAVWERAGKAVTIDVSYRIKKAVERINTNYEHLESKKDRLVGYLKVARPHQWTKNILVFVPMFAGHHFQAIIFLESALSFVAFSLIASSVYVTNDLLDLDADRIHPRKKARPFASGAIPANHGILLASILFFAGFATSLLLDPVFTLVLLAYYSLTSVYSLSLKRKPISDIFTLAVLYTLRIIGGGFATDVTMSFWLLAFSISIFFSLACIKRQGELIDLLKRGELQTIGRGYETEDLRLVATMAISSGFMSVLVMALYVNSPSVLALYSSTWALMAVCGVLLYWIVHMCFMTHRGAMHDDPIVFALKDKISRYCLLVIAGFLIGGKVI